MNTRKPLERPLGDTEYMLEQWGWWRMDGMGIPRYISPLYALMREHTPCESSAKSYVITDDLALAVDTAVSRLTSRNEQMGLFIWLYYGAKWPALRIARQFNIGEAKAREVIKAGVAWVDCALEQIRCAA